MNSIVILWNSLSFAFRLFNTITTIFSLLLSAEILSPSVPLSLSLLSSTLAFTAF